MKTTNKAFTLIELLTVVAIIAILVGLLFPAIKGAMIKAESARARVMVQQIGTAMRAYFTEYSVWPTNTTGTTTFILTTNLFQNTGSITFLDVSPNDIGATNSTYPGAILDPWKSPYYCRVDGTFSGNGTVIDPLDNTSTITNGYAVWSYGPDGQSDLGGDNSALNKDNVRSW